jgi:hypothetical protein
MRKRKKVRNERGLAGADIRPVHDKRLDPGDFSLPGFGSSAPMILLLPVVKETGKSISLGSSVRHRRAVKEDNLFFSIGAVGVVG